MVWRRRKNTEDRRKDRRRRNWRNRKKQDRRS